MELERQKIKRRTKSNRVYFVAGASLTLGLGILASTVKPYISKEEKQKEYIDSKLEQLFKYDENRDGFISRDEYIKYLEEN